MSAGSAPRPRRASRARSRHAPSRRRAGRGCRPGRRRASPRRRPPPPPRAMAWPWLAGGAVGDVAHRVDRLVRRPGGDEHALAGERARRASAPRSRLERRRRSRAARPCGPGRTRLGHGALVRPDDGDAVARQRREVALRRRVQPHAHVHRRRDQDRQRRSPGARSRRGRRRARTPSSPSGSAVAGATTTRSASRASRIWPISASSVAVEQVGMGARRRQARRPRAASRTAARPWSGCSARRRRARAAAG